MTQQLGFPWAPPEKKKKKKNLAQERRETCDQLLRADVRGWVKPGGTPLYVVGEGFKRNGVPIDRLELLHLLHGAGFRLSMRLRENGSPFKTDGVADWIVRPALSKKGGQ